MSFNGAPVVAATVVAVDVGKNTAALLVTDAARHRLFGPVEFAMTASAVVAVVERVCAVLPVAGVKVGVEAAGHYHRPLLGSGVWPAGWELLELSPTRVAEQRRGQGRRRVKTDAIDLEAITDRPTPQFRRGGLAAETLRHRSHTQSIGSTGGRDGPLHGGGAVGTS